MSARTKSSGPMSADPLVRAARRAATAGGVTGLASLALVLGGEITQGAEFMETSWAAGAGWLGFASASLLVLGISGLLLGFQRSFTSAGRIGILGMQFAAAVMAGCAATLPLVVAGIAERSPEIVNDPPVAVPATFILSGIALGVSGIVTTVALRRAGLAAGWTGTLMIVASVVTMLPLPSRSFLLAFAVSVLLARVGGPELEREPARALTA